jgi:hypothetical protein
MLLPSSASSAVKTFHLKQVRRNNRLYWILLVAKNRLVKMPPAQPAEAYVYNDTNAKDIDLTELRQQLGLTGLFSGTIKTIYYL